MEDGNCDIKILTRVGLAKGVFQNINNSLTTGRLSLGTKKVLLDCYVIYIILYGGVC